MNRKQRRGAQKIAAASSSSDPVAQLFAQAVASHQAGAFAEAQVGCERVLALQPDHVEAHYGLGVALQMQNQLDSAAAAYRNALALHPGHIDALANLGVALKDLGRLDEAEAACRRALAMGPASARAFGNLGAVLIDREKLEEAAVALRKAIALDPDHLWSLCSLVGALQRQGKFEEAIAVGKRAVALRPDFPAAQFNLAIALGKHGALDESIAALSRVLALEPNAAEAHFFLAQVFLLRGDFARGWQEYEWRWKLREYAWIGDVRGALDHPRWTGEDIADKTILLCAEQGLGDTLQFVRYAPLVVAKARRVILMVQPALKPLLASIAGVTLIGLDELAPDFDLFCPLLSLPRLLDQTPGTIPGRTPYLAADAAAVERWRLRLGEHGLRIGIAWQGKPGVSIDRGRSIPLAAFAPLARVPDVRLISLQKNDGVAQLAELPEGMRVESLGPDFDAGPGAFLDAAAVMMNLDLIIASDTAIAHLAGALGRPTWLALKAVPDWRWRLATPRSDWYPTMRLFRQSAAGDWDGVFAEMAAALTQFAAARGAPSEPGPLETAIAPMANPSAPSPDPSASPARLGRPVYPRSLAGKVALMIGGVGAIGAATSRMLAAAGASVAVTHRATEGGGGAARALLGELGDGHAAFVVDVADTASLVALRAAVEARYGRLDILVNAAGFTKPVPHADLDALTDELIDRMFAVNWRGQFAAIRTFAPLLKASGDGLVVSVSSIAGLTGNGSSIAYCAAKAGVDVMTKSLARALAPEVRVLAVSPGVVDTPFVPGRDAGFNDKASAATPLKRIAEAEDVAAAILACATMLGYSTGHIIQVDGGRAL